MGWHGPSDLAQMAAAHSDQVPKEAKQTPGPPGLEQALAWAGKVPGKQAISKYKEGGGCQERGGVNKGMPSWPQRQGADASGQGRGKATTPHLPCPHAPFAYRSAAN